MQSTFHLGSSANLRPVKDRWVYSKGRLCPINGAKHWFIFKTSENWKIKRDDDERIINSMEE